LSITDADDTDRGLALSNDLPALEDELARRTDVRLVVLDPLNAFLTERIESTRAPSRSPSSEAATASSLRSRRPRRDGRSRSRARWPRR
jgi:hypothetical protein